jgi:hypothetical protein
LSLFCFPHSFEQVALDDDACWVKLERVCENEIDTKEDLDDVYDNIFRKVVSYQGGLEQIAID